MKRRHVALLTVTVLGLCTLTASAQEQRPALVDAPGPVTIEYVAHACFRITAPSGDRVLIDPFASRVWIGYDYPSGIDADAVLISHPHYDHDGGASVGQRVPWPDGARVLRQPGAYEVGDLRIRGVAGKHADPYGKEFGQTNTIWVLEVAGLRIAHLGDNGPVSDTAAEQIGQVDVLMMPIDSQFHILKQHEIDTILEQLSPTVVVPMHYRLPDLEPDEDEPDDLGDIEGWLVSQRGVRRLSGHATAISSEELPESREILVFQHWPELEPPAEAEDER